MPGGEVFTAPHEDSIEGFVAFEYPAVYGGYEVEGVKLVFKRGEVVEASATRGAEFLKKMLDVDEGAKRVGEIAFGLNYDITRFTKEILFDEKLGAQYTWLLEQHTLRQVVKTFHLYTGTWLKT
jgi:aminopeptidase